MTLRKKTLLLIGSVLFLTFLMLLISSRTILFESYSALEQKFLKKDVAQVLNILEDDLLRLQSTTEDWAFWDDTYQFASGKNESYIQDNLADDTFRTLNLQFIVIYDAQGKLLYGKSLDYVGKQPIPFPKELGRLSMALPKGAQGKIGMLWLRSYGTMMFAVKPILTSKETGPMQGYLLMGRLLDLREQNRIARITNLKLRAYPVGSRPIMLELGRDSEKLSHGNVVVKPVSNNKASAYAVINDPSRAAIAILKIEVPREIYRQAKNGMLWFMISVFIIGIILAFSIVFLLERTVLSKLAKLDARVTEIGNKHDLSFRFELSGHDELTNLARSMNQMLSALEEAQMGMQTSEAKLRAMFENTPTPIFLIDQETTGITDANQAGLDFLECSASELIKKKCWEKENIIETLRSFDSMMARAKTLEVDCAVHDVTKTLLLNLVPVTVGEKKMVYAIGQDITERKQLEEELLDLSMNDTLTGLRNRICFERELARFDRGQQKVAVLRCDVDGLRLINESLGTKTGDEVLSALADILRSAVRKNDLVARTGGDDFTVLMPSATPDEIEEVVRSIRNGIYKYNAKHLELPLSVSIGFCAEDTISPNDSLKLADQHMSREKIHRNLSARNALVQALTKAMEARDFVTEGHADRMQRMVMDLGEAFGLPHHRVVELGLLAKFHDIGKVGIPDRILFKDKALTAEEKKEMERHCEIGYRIAQSTPDLAPIADWILKHHEWWDGSGYPLGLYGYEIPLECRLIAIIDAFDAMTNDRPYRKALSTHQALQEIKKCAGYQFDPTIVEKFLELMETWEDKSNKEPRDSK